MASFRNVEGIVYGVPALFRRPFFKMVLKALFKAF